MAEEGFVLRHTLGNLASLVGSLMPAKDAVRIKTFQEQVAGITSRREKIKLTRDHFERYCLAVDEPNKAHVNRAAAQSLGLEDVFAPGMQLVALGEQYIGDLLGGINGIVDTPFIPTQMDVAFGTEVVYPDTSLTWLCYGYDVSQEGQVLLSILGAERKNLKGIDFDQEITSAVKKLIKRRGTTIDVRLGHQLPIEDRHLYSANGQSHPGLSDESLRDFLLSICEDPNEHQDIPWIYVPAFFAAAVLNYFKDHLGGSAGIHTSSQFIFYERPCITDEDGRGRVLDIDLFARSSRRMVDMVASQGHKPLIYGSARFMPPGRTGVG